MRQADPQWDYKQIEIQQRYCFSYRKINMHDNIDLFGNHFNAKLPRLLAKVWLNPTFV